jgi:hypothetical protein
MAGSEARSSARFPLIFTQRRILPLALAFALAGVVFADGPWTRGVSGTFALATAVAAWVQRRARPALVLDERGYAVEEHGREKLRVAWSEVVKVRADEEEHALYLDCGDPSRNLLVPPVRGYGFHFEHAEELYRRILEAVPDKVEPVARLDMPPPAKKP